MKQVVIARHAPYMKTKENSGDGPLTTEGVAVAEAEAAKLVKELEGRGIKAIDHAVVSGSIRGMQTFALYWAALLVASIQVWKVESDKRYFSTEEEDAEWTKIFTTQFAPFRDFRDEHGEAKAIMKFGGRLVRACAARTIDAIDQALADEATVVMVMTHGPHDLVIAQYCGHKFDEGLEKGCYRILDIT